MSMEKAMDGNSAKKTLLGEIRKLEDRCERLAYLARQSSDMIMEFNNPNSPSLIDDNTARKDERVSGSIIDVLSVCVDDLNITMNAIEENIATARGYIL